MGVIGASQCYRVLGINLLYALETEQITLGCQTGFFRLRAKLYGAARYADLVDHIRYQF